MQRLLLLLLAATLAAQPNLTLDLQAAMQKETVHGDLRAAIAMYEKIVARAGANRDVAARALVRIGQCQEKLGNAEARKAYERVVRDFADQPGAAEARARLAAIASPALAPKVLYSDPDIHSPRPNRDGRVVAAFCGVSLCVIDAATAQRTTVVPAPTERGARYWRPLPSPDGRSLAYVRFTSRNGESFAELLVRQLPQGTETVLASGLKDTYSPVDWTADGKTVLFAKIDPTGIAGLHLIPAAGGKANPVPTPDFNWAAGRDNSKISPDGKWLAYPVSKDKKQGGGYVPTDVAVIPLSGGQPNVVLDGAGHERVVGWLTSGDLIATSDRNGKVLPYRLRIANGLRQGDPVAVESNLGEATVVGVAPTGALFLSTGIRRTQLHAFSPDLKTSKPFPTGYEADSPVFSPDGKTLAYFTGGLTGAIVLRDVATGAERRLPAEIPRVRNLGWYPDSRHLFAIVNEGNWGNRRTFRFDAQSGAMTPLPEVTGMSAYWAPAILADGKTLIYTGHDDNENGVIVALDTVSGEKRTLLRAAAPYTGIGTFSLSPDRRRIAYVQYNRATNKVALTLAELPNLEPKILNSCDRAACGMQLPYFTPSLDELLLWTGNETQPGAAALARFHIPTGQLTELKKHPFTPDGPAFHPGTGEIILGTYTYVSELRIK